MSIKQKNKITAFPLSDVKWPEKTNKPVFTSRVKQEAAHHEVGVPYFGEVISTATTALAAVVANWRQHRRVMGATLKRQAVIVYEGLLGGDSP